MPFRPRSTDLNVNQVDWRQLRRWGISESRVPAGTLVQFRLPTAWDRFKVYIVGAVIVLAAQFVLISGLLLQRRRRQHAERDARNGEAALRASYERIRDLGGRLLLAQEEERARLARELHDDICQQLGLLAFELDLLRHEEPKRRKADRAFASALDLAHGAVKSVHDLSHRLHPARLRLVGLVAGDPGSGARAVETRIEHRLLARLRTGTAARRSLALSVSGRSGGAEQCRSNTARPLT